MLFGHDVIGSLLWRYWDMNVIDVDVVTSYTVRWHWCSFAVTLRLIVHIATRALSIEYLAGVKTWNDILWLLKAMIIQEATFP